MFHKPICNWTTHDNATHDLRMGFRQFLYPTRGVSDGRDTYLFFCKVVQNVWDDRNLNETMMSLYGGARLRSPNAYPPPLLVDNPPLEHPTKPVVDIDIEYLQGVCIANSFAHSDSLRGKGLYSLPSLLNHSCLPSVHKEFLGNMMLVRASRDMKKGEEVTTAYLSDNKPYDERQFRLKRSWKFKCSCVACEAASKDSLKARETRRELMKRINPMLSALVTRLDKKALEGIVSEAKKICEDMRKTYSEAHSTLMAGIKLELAEAVMYYASLTERLGNVGIDPTMLKLTLELRMECLDLSGIRVCDRSKYGALPKDAEKTPLPIDKSQVATPQRREIIFTMLQIVQQFEQFSDKKRAQRWLDAVLYGSSVRPTIRVDLTKRRPTVGKVYSGGSNEVFKILYGSHLPTLGLTGRI